MWPTLEPLKSQDFVLGLKDESERELGQRQRMPPILISGDLGAESCDPLEADIFNSPSFGSDTSRSFPI